MDPQRKEKVVYRAAKLEVALEAWTYDNSDENWLLLIADCLEGLRYTLQYVDDEIEAADAESDQAQAYGLSDCREEALKAISQAEQGLKQKYFQMNEAWMEEQECRVKGDGTEKAEFWFAETRKISKAKCQLEVKERMERAQRVFVSDVQHSGAAREH